MMSQVPRSGTDCSKTNPQALEDLLLVVILVAVFVLWNKFFYPHSEPKISAQELFKMPETRINKRKTLKPLRLQGFSLWQREKDLNPLKNRQKC